MADEHEEIRNYQRIFRPDRRVYAVDGHPLPIPGGVPVTWIVYFAVTLLSILMLSAGTLMLVLVIALGAGIYGYRVGGTPAAVIAGGVTAVALPPLGGIISTVDWPIRLIILPALVATLGTQVAPDGRKPHRYAVSWLNFKLRPRRRSLGRPVSIDGRGAPYAPELWVAPDQHSTQLRRGRVRGPGIVRFRDELAVHGRRRGKKITARALATGREPRRHEVLVDSVELAPGERLEVRP